MATVTRLCFAGDDNSDHFISTNPLALVVGMLLDQQVPMERAFAAPYQLAQRLHVDFTAQAIAGLPADELESCFRQPPALHRYPGMMATRVHALCSYIAQRYSGDVTALWRNARDADEVYDAVCDLPGFGEQKARIFVALLGKQMGVTPTGWEAVAGPYALPGHRSVADVTDRDSLGRVRMYKREHKRAG